MSTSSEMVKALCSVKHVIVLWLYNFWREEAGTLGMHPEVKTVPNGCCNTIFVSGIIGNHCYQYEIQNIYDVMDKYAHSSFEVPSIPVLDSTQQGKVHVCRLNVDRYM